MNNSKSKNLLAKGISQYILFLIYPALFLIYCFVASKSPGHGGDNFCWAEWAAFDAKNGLSNAYKSGTDYLPLYHYVLYIFGKIQGSKENIYTHLYQLRYFTLFVEFIAGLVLYKLIHEKYISKYKSVAYSMFYFANFAIFYNTIIWGQVDGILTSFVFFSFVFAYRRKTLWAIVFFILAINFKLQAIVFFPVIGLLLLPSMADKFSWKNLTKWILIPVFLQFLIILPFIISQNLSNLGEVVFGSVGKYPVVSMNAYNIWDLLLNGDLMKISDLETFGGISYKTWGLLIFFTTSFFALFHLLKWNYCKIFLKKKDSFSLEKTLITFSLIPLLFFYFNTQMHERYVHPALLFMAAYTILYKRPIAFILLCLTYLANLDDVLKYFRMFDGIPNLRIWCSICYLICIIVLFIELSGYKFPIKPKKNESRHLSNNSHLQ